MDGSTDRSARRATELIDELVVGHRELARAQAWCAGLMMEFAETRSVCDRRVIADRAAAGVEAGTGRVNSLARKSAWPCGNRNTLCRTRWWSPAGCGRTPRTRGMRGGPVTSPTTR